jgi:hypothetical protein
MSRNKLQPLNVIFAILKDQYGCSSLFLESPKEPIDMKTGIVRD